jgi:IS5 family transposase
MPHQTFAEIPFEHDRKSTRRERFLNEMNRVVSWADLVAMIESVYPKAKGAGHPPVGIDRMRRLHGLQQGFNPSDPGGEEALHDSRALRQCVGIALGREPMPDETTICKGCHLLEAHQVGAQLCARIGTDLAAQGLPVNRGTIVEATLISASRSTTQRTKERDPARQQTKKGSPRNCGMKAHN